MKYFILKHSTEGIGPTFPQSETYTQTVNYNHPDSAQYMNYDPKCKSFVEFVDLVPRAKMTDLISAGCGGVMKKVVSRKIINVLEEFMCTAYNLYPVKIRQKGEVVEEYYLLKSNEDSFFRIDNRVSEVTLRIKDDIFDFSKYSREEFLELFNNELEGSRYKGELFFFYDFDVKRIVLEKGFSYDFFSARTVPIPRPGIFLSERLVEALNEAGITGAKYIEVPEIN